MGKSATANDDATTDPVEVGNPSRLAGIFSGTPLRSFLTIFSLLGLATMSLYWPAIWSGLVSDDWGLSVPDPDVWKSFLGFWFGGGHGAFYRPLSRLLI